MVWANGNNSNDTNLADSVTPIDRVAGGMMLSVSWLSYSLKDVGFEFQNRQEFFSSPKRPDKLWGLVKLLISVHYISFRRVNRPRYEVDHFYCSYMLSGCEEWQLYSLLASYTVITRTDKMYNSHLNNTRVLGNLHIPKVVTLVEGMVSVCERAWKHVCVCVCVCVCFVRKILHVHLVPNLQPAEW